jgi:hypothetical protein
VVVVLERQRRAAVLQEARVGGRGLHDGTVGRQVAVKDRGRLLGHGLGHPADHRGVVDLGTREIPAQRPAVDRGAAEVELVLELGQQRLDAAGVEEVLHQVPAGGADVGEDRNLARQLIEALQGERDAGPAGDRDQMDHGVGRAAHRQVAADRVVDRRGREDVGGLQAFPDHPDDPPAGRGAHARVAGVGGRDRGGAGQREAQGLGDGGHGGGGAHGHAHAGRAGDAALDLVPIPQRDRAGLELGPALPAVRARARAQDPALPVAAQHGPCRDEDRGQAHRDRPHEQPGVVLSQPPMSTAPSIGCERSSSSVSMARKLR